MGYHNPGQIHARAWAVNAMEADSASDSLENSTSGGLAIAKTAVAAASASTSGRGAGVKTAVTTRLSQSSAHQRTCMGCQCHGD